MLRQRQRIIKRFSIIKRYIHLETNSNFKGLEMSPTLRMNEMQKMISENGDQVYRFGFGQSPLLVYTLLYT